MADLPDGFFNLKHRLVGATVLILAAVVLLPRVLTEPDRGFIGSTGVVEQEVFPQIKPEIVADIQPAISDSLDVSARTTIEILDDVEATIHKESPGQFDPISKEKLLRR